MAAASAPSKPAPETPDLIVGLGTTGLSCARYLARRGVAFQVADSRERPPGLEALRRDFPRVPVHLGPFDPALFASAGRLVLSPGVALATPAVAQAAAAGIPVLGDIELFAREARAPVVAITGSNGKSTVTTLVGDMAARAGLEVRVGGNLGTPALDLLGPTEPALYVLELSSFQLETTRSLAAAAACVLNISADHLDRYPDLASYTAAKRRIYAGARVLLVNRDDPLVVAMLEPGRRALGFTLELPANGDFGLETAAEETWLRFGPRRLLAESALAMRGRHNTANALAALALGHAAGLPWEPMLEALRQFRGLPHRCQWVAARDGVDWFDDSKGTNVGATVAAIAGLQVAGRLILILGGQGKGQDFTALRGPVAERARGVVLIGRDAPLLRAVLEGLVPLVEARSMEAAVAAARDLARPGDAVLLSPACASFDMFADYAARGAAFAAAVRRESQG